MNPNADLEPSIFIINKKITFLKKFLSILLFEGTIKSFFKHDKSKRSHKTEEIKVFLTIFA